MQIKIYRSLFFSRTFALKLKIGSVFEIGACWSDRDALTFSSPCTAIFQRCDKQALPVPPDRSRPSYDGAICFAPFDIPEETISQRARS